MPNNVVLRGQASGDHRHQEIEQQMPIYYMGLEYYDIRDTMEVEVMCVDVSVCLAFSLFQMQPRRCATTAATPIDRDDDVRDDARGRPLAASTWN